MWSLLVKFVMVACLLLFAGMLVLFGYLVPSQAHWAYSIAICILAGFALTFMMWLVLYGDNSFLLACAKGSICIGVLGLAALHGWDPADPTIIWPIRSIQAVAYFIAVGMGMCAGMSVGDEVAQRIAFWWRGVRFRITEFRQRHSN